MVACNLCTILLAVGGKSGAGFNDCGGVFEVGSKKAYSSAKILFWRVLENMEITFFSSALADSKHVESMFTPV